MSNRPTFAALRDSLLGVALRGSRGNAYIVRECIGEGGQGWVFTANYDTSDGVVMVVKVLRPAQVSDEASRRFEREADVLRMLSAQHTPNPYIVRFFDHARVTAASPAGDTHSLQFIVLEYVHGITLAQAIDRQPDSGMSAERALRILRQTAHALDHVHAHDIIHRDLKPSNILLATDGGVEVAKITDFGLAKLTAIEAKQTIALAGASVGYAPAEQYEHGNRRVGPQTDVFSLAAVAFEMLSGQMAFPFREGDSPLVCVTQMLNGARPLLLDSSHRLCPELQRQPEIVAEIDAVLARGLAAEPAERFASAGELVAALSRPLRAANAHGSNIAAPSGVFSVAATVPKSDEAAAALERDLAVARSSRVGSAATIRADGFPLTAPSPAVRDARDRERPTAPDASPPSQWRWSVVSPSVRPDLLRGATFFDAGATMVAIGAAGLTRWADGRWSALGRSTTIDYTCGRGLASLPSGEVLVFGASGLVVIVGGTGTEKHLVSPDKEAIFHGVHVDPVGSFTLVGERPSRGLLDRTGSSDAVAIAAHYTENALTNALDVSPVARLCAVTRLASGQLVGCGERGSLVTIGAISTTFIGSLCGGDLKAIAATADGRALTVGTGGHALTLSPTLAWELEAVQTARDLTCLAVSPAGTVWVGAQQARILRRTQGSWLRMSDELNLSSNVVALFADARSVRAVCSDGAVIDGILH